MNEKILKFINKFASKNGGKEVKSFEDLTSEEKDTYREWEVALSGRKLTDDDVQAFLNTELDTAVTRLTDVDLKVEDAVFRKVEVRLIKKIINFLNMPAIEKALVEKQLEK
jgi:anaerobic ribonucleoside-triphosphate reductase